MNAASFTVGLISLSLLAVGCRSAPEGPGADWSQAVGTTWQLSQIGSQRPLNDRVPTLTLAADGRVAGHAGANRFFGTYERTDNGTIHFGALGRSRMHLDRPAGLMAQEQKLLDALAEVDRYHLAPPRLTFYADDEPRLVWVAPTPASQP